MIFDTALPVSHPGGLSEKPEDRTKMWVTHVGTCLSIFIPLQPIFLKGLQREEDMVQILN